MVGVITELGVMSRSVTPGVLTVNGLINSPDSSEYYEEGCFRSAEGDGCLPIKSSMNCLASLAFTALPYCDGSVYAGEVTFD